MVRRTRRGSPGNDAVPKVGLEPTDDFATTSVLPCGCVVGPECSAAIALQMGHPEWLDSALNDVNLRRVILAWPVLPEPIRTAIRILVRGHCP